MVNGSERFRDQLCMNPTNPLDLLHANFFLYTFLSITALAEHENPQNQSSNTIH